LGLIVNELITNAVKYAFPDDRPGEIAISAKQANGLVELTIRDDGIGLPENLDWQKTNTLGLKLVKMLTENQLDGSLNLTSSSGTCFTLRFSLAEN
jgi:two-component sensor histidine kinase